MSFQPVDLRALRKELGYTQLDIALTLGVSRQTYNRWEQHPEVMPVGIYKATIDEFDRAKTVREGGLVVGNTREEDK